MTGGSRVLALVVLLVAGAVLRLRAAGQGMVGDELSTYWLATEKSFGGMLSALRHETEITPPLSFALSWLTTRFGETTELARAPAVIAGTAAIPLVWVLGERTVGSRAGLVAAVLTACSPFLIFYSSEARAYMPMTVLVVLAALALLQAIEDGRPRWWALYGLCTCGAVYAHYMSIFALVTLAAWGLWVAPHARKALAATLAAAAVAYLPWAGGLRGDLRSPDSGAIDLFAPFSADVVRTSLGRWFIGDPGLAADLSGVPGRLALVAVVAGVVLGVAGALAYRRSAARPRSTARTVLVVAMALATPVGLALGSVVGSDMFVTRSLAASTPWLLLAVGALLTSAGRLRIPATVLVVAAFAMGATRAVEQRFARPDFDAAAGYVDASAGREDTVVDSAVFFLTPGPLSGLDAALERPHRLIRNGAPQQREHNFRPDEPVLPTDEVLRRAVAPGGRVFVVVVDPPRTPETVADAARTWDRLAAALPRPYRREKLVTFESAFDLGVLVYVPAPAGGR